VRCIPICSVYALCIIEFIVYSGSISKSKERRRSDKRCRQVGAAFASKTKQKEEVMHIKNPPGLF
jgi:hypothetical protein